MCSPIFEFATSCPDASDAVGLPLTRTATLRTAACRRLGIVDPNVNELEPLWRLNKEFDYFDKTEKHAPGLGKVVHKSPNNNHTTTI